MNDKKINELNGWLKTNGADVAYISNPATIAYFQVLKVNLMNGSLLFVAPGKIPFFHTSSGSRRAKIAAGL